MIIPSVTPLENKAGKSTVALFTVAAKHAGLIQVCNWFLGRALPE